jgi:hypothetical protein
MRRNTIEKRFGAAAVALALLVAPSVAQAQAKEDAPADPPLAEGDDREVPDYDGREAPTDAGDVLIWIPRVVLSPLYFVSEFIVRRPLGWLVTAAEKEKIPALLVDFFTFGPEQNAGIVPTALLDFGFRPSVGLYFFWNEFIADNNKLRARAAWGGSDWLMFTLADRLEVLPEHEISLRGQFLKRPDWVFHGIGPDSRGAESRFTSTALDGGLVYESKLWRSSSLESFVAVRSVKFDPDTGCCSDPTLGEEIALGEAAGGLEEPPGLSSGYTVMRHGIEAALDSRPRRHLQDPRPGSDFVSPPGSGIRLDLRGEHAAGLRLDSPLPGAPEERYHYIKYGATLGGYVDVTGEQRVLGLSVIADFADPWQDGGSIPFTEQVTLGGSRPMRGFLHGRLVDRSSAVAHLEYQWPVWVWLDGAMHYSVGNVFGEHLDGLEAKKLRSSFGIGMRANSARDHAFEVLLAVGTKTFDEGSGIDHVRFVLGATSGF